MVTDTARRTSNGSTHAGVNTGGTILLTTPRLPMDMAICRPVRGCRTATHPNFQTRPWRSRLYALWMELFGQSISSIHPRPRRKGWVRVCLADGSTLELTESRCAELRLTPGATLDADRLGVCRRAAEVDAIKHRALRLLASRARSRAELAERLAPADPAVLEQAMDELAAAGLVDDAAFARRLFEQEVERGPGRAGMARARLTRAGIDERLIEQIESQLAPDPVADARALVERRIRAAPSLDRQRLAARLFRLLAARGFDEETARSAIESALGTMEHEYHDLD